MLLLPRTNISDVVSTLNPIISGTFKITFGFPPKSFIFALMSPNVLDTAKPPGFILNT